MEDVSNRNRDAAGRFANEHPEPEGVSLPAPKAKEPEAHLRVQAVHLGAITGQPEAVIHTIARAVSATGPGTVERAAVIDTWVTATALPEGSLTFITSQMQEAELAGPGNPASILAKAAGTPLDPTSLAMPPYPRHSVEIEVSDDTVESIMDRACMDVDLSQFKEVYADVDLYGKDEGDFWGVRPDGGETIIGLGVNLGDYIDLEYGDLSFRGDHVDPRPEYLERRAEWKESRLQASTVLLEAMGIKGEPYWNGTMLTNASGGTLELKTDFYGVGKLVETRNWREAGEADVEAFLGGKTTPAATKAFTVAAATVHGR